jgi:protein-S-isoprenylcysteine O-methyltransferase Ste14
VPTQDGQTALLLLLKNILFTVLVPGTVAVYVPFRIAARSGPPFEFNWTVERAFAFVPLALGAMVYAWCLWDFAVNGRGTPAPIDAPKRLVAQGLYRYVRNPMYVGVVFIIVGWAILFQSRGVLMYAAIVAAGFHVFVVLVEEPILARKFGADYERYRREVRRWLPRMRREHSA